MTNLTTMTAEFDALTLTLTDLAAEIRRNDYQTISTAIADFQTVNARRVTLMRLLNLIPAGM